MPVPPQHPEGRKKQTLESEFGDIPKLPAKALLGAEEGEVKE